MEFSAWKSSFEEQGFIFLDDEGHDPGVVLDPDHKDLLFGARGILKSGDERALDNGIGNFLEGEATVFAQPFILFLAPVDHCVK